MSITNRRQARRLLNHLGFACSVVLGLAWLAAAVLCWASATAFLAW